MNGSFDHAEGAVYQDFMNHVVPPFNIKEKIKKEGWLALGGADFGIRDHTVLVLGAIDPTSGTVYIYNEYYKNGVAVPEHARNMNEMLNDIPSGGLMKLVGDPSGKRQNLSDNRSVFDHYREYGIFFQPGNNRIDAGIAKVQAYFSLGRLKIFSSCVNLIREGINYKYKPLELDSQKNLDEKPIDKDNHTMDSLRYLVQELPDDPNNLKNQSYKPYHKAKVAESNLPFALQTPKNEYTSSSTAWYSKYY